MDNSRLLRKDRQGRRGRRVALSVIEGLECLELTIGNGTVESLLIRIKVQTNNVNFTVGVHSGPPSQHNDTDKLFLEELRDDFKSTAPGVFNLPEINWELVSNCAEGRTSRNCPVDTADPTL